MNNMKKELQGLEEGSEANIPRITQNQSNTQVPIWKMPGHDGKYGFWF